MNINSIAWSNDDKYIAAGIGLGTTGMLQVWNRKNGDLAIELPTTDEVITVQFSENNMYIIANTIYNLIIIHVDMSTDPYYIYTSDHSRILCASVLKYNHSVATYDEKGKVSIFNIELNELQKEFDFRILDAISLETSFDGRYIFIGDKFGLIICIDISVNTEMYSVKLQSSSVVQSIQLNHIGELLVCDGEITIYNTVSKLITKNIKINTWALCANFLKNSRYIAAGCIDGKLHLWDRWSDYSKTDLSGHNQPITCICASPDESFFATGSIDSSIKVWSVQTGLEIAQLKTRQ